MCLTYILVFSIIEMQLALEISRMLMIDPILIGIFPLSIGSGIPDMLEILDEV
jgi:Ca2+/Na+ antiporter